MRPRDGFRWTYLGGLALTAIALPWSEFLMSNAQIILAANFLLEGIVRRDLKGRFVRVFTNPAALAFIGFYLLHVLGLLWTDDMSWGLDLCRILAPAFIFTVILSGTPRIAADELRTVLLLGAASVIASTLWCWGRTIMDVSAHDFRDWSRFISHIRLALLLCMSVFVFAYYWPQRWSLRVVSGAAIAWALYFLDVLQSVAGIVMLLCLVLFALWRWSSAFPRSLRFALRASLVLVPIACAGYVWWCWTALEHVEPLDRSRMAMTSAGGEAYYNNFEGPQVENGHYVWVQVADTELRRGWERVSTIPYSGRDRRDQPVRWTLVRYLASMGVTKDSMGLLALHEEDVRRVESGVTSVVDGRRFALRTRIEQVLYELDQYHMSGDPSGHSLAMRLEFWKTGLAIAREHPLVGVGTGDTRPAFKEMYTRTNSPLGEQWRLRAHNEFLTLLISFGVLGLLFALFSWWWPAWREDAWRSPLFVAFMIIFLFSCLTDDTVETQPGATFFAFFYTLLVFAAPRREVSAPIT